MDPTLGKDLLEILLSSDLLSSELIKKLKHTGKKGLDFALLY